MHHFAFSGCHVHVSPHSGIMHQGSRTEVPQDWLHLTPALPSPPLDYALDSYESVQSSLHGPFTPAGAYKFVLSDRSHARSHRWLDGMCEVKTQEYTATYVFQKSIKRKNTHMQLRLSWRLKFRRFGVAIWAPAGNAECREANPGVFSMLFGNAFICFHRKLASSPYMLDSLLHHDHQS